MMSLVREINIIKNFIRETKDKTTIFCCCISLFSLAFRIKKLVMSNSYAMQTEDPSRNYRQLDSFRCSK